VSGLKIWNFIWNQCYWNNRKFCNCWANVQKCRLEGNSDLFEGKLVTTLSSIK